MIVFIFIMLLLAASLLFGKIAERMEQPPIVGNIIGGIVFGPLFLALLKWLYGMIEIPDIKVLYTLLDPDLMAPEVEFLLDFSIVVLMFASGFETRIRDFIASFRRGIVTASIGVVLPFALGFIGTYLYLGDWIISLYVGGALSITAVALSVASLINIDAIHTRFGMTIINAAIVDDIIGILLLTVILSISRTGRIPGLSFLIGIFVLAVIFVLFVLFISPMLLKLIYRRSRELRSTEGLGITILVAALFGFIAHIMGLHLMIGAFLGGMAVRETLSKRVQQSIKKWAFGFFAPIFFAYVGYSVTLSGAAISPLLPLIIVLGFTGKVFGAGIGAKISGLRWSESLLVGLGMNGRAAVDLILASVALNAGMIGRDLFSVLVLNAGVMAVLTPILIKATYKRFSKRGWIAGNGS